MKSLHYHSIPSFASPKSLFQPQLGSRKTSHASNLDTEDQNCPRCNQCRPAQAVWDRCRPSTPRRDPRMGELAHSSRRCAKPFLPNHCHSEDNQSCLPRSLWKPSRWRASHKGVLHIPQSSGITGASPSDCLVSCLGHSLSGWGSYPSAEKRSVYSTAQLTGQCTWGCGTCLSLFWRICSTIGLFRE